MGDVEKVLADLQRVKANMGYDSWGEDWDGIMAAGIALIKKQAAALVDKDAEVERLSSYGNEVEELYCKTLDERDAAQSEVRRLTGRAITKPEIAAALNRIKYRKNDDWTWTGSEFEAGRYWGQAYVVKVDLFTAEAVFEKLLREAAKDPSHA
jgi:hypothetical protein